MHDGAEPERERENLPFSSRKILYDVGQWLLVRHVVLLLPVATAFILINTFNNNYNHILTQRV